MISFYINFFINRLDIHLMTMTDVDVVMINVNFYVFEYYS